MAEADATHTYQSSAGIAHVDAPAAVGPFIIGKRLGAGGMGVVFQATHSDSGQKVAVKLLSQTGTQNAESVDRFQREGQIAASISHPRSTFVFAAGEHDGKCYIAMELMPGGTLKDLVESGGPLPVNKAVDYVLDIIDGLSAAHKVGVIHRDVKPSNCFVDEGGRVKVGDYGLSKSLWGDAGLTRTGAFMGTPQYAAPEQITGGKIDRRTDVYAIGGTLFYLLTGQAPFVGDAAKVIAGIAAETAPKIRTINHSVPMELESVIAQSLEKNKEKRQTNLRELRDALLPFSSRGSSIADVGRRLAAYLLDTLCVGLGTAVLTIVAMITLFMIFSQPQWFERSSDIPGILMTVSLTFVQVFSVVVFFGYFEGIHGWSPGKRLLGLRTIGPSGGKPGLFRAALRALIVPGIASGLVAIYSLNSFQNLSETTADSWSLYLQNIEAQVMTIVGWAIALACFVTARSKNGYRGIHEFLTRTRVVRVSARAQENHGSVPATLPMHYGGQQNFGNYNVVGSLGAIPGGTVLSAIDTVLSRPVWIYVFDHAAINPFSTTLRKTLNRSTRQRFLDQGTLNDGKVWVVVEAVNGSPVTALQKSNALDWDDATDLLEELCAELEADSQSDALLPTLMPQQIWIDTNGRLKIVELPVLSLGQETDAKSFTSTGIVKFFVTLIKRWCTVPGRYLDLFQQLQTRDDDDHAATSWIKSELTKDRARGTSWGWDDRMGVLGISTSIECTLAYVLSMIVAFGFWSFAEFKLINAPNPVWLAVVLFAVLQIAVVVAAVVFKGGLAFWIASVEIRNRNDHSAGLAHIALRNFVAWLPISFFLAVVASSMVASASQFGTDPMFGNSTSVNLTISAFGLGMLLPVLVAIVGAIVSVARPSRGIQDLICQTRIGPR
jgi:eukaryotic-like serine/threonine-protein kinase